VKTAILLNDTLKSVVSGGDSLTLSGNITSTSTSETVFVTGAGKTIISGVNTYGPAAGTVGTSLTGGATLNVANNSALSAGDLSSAASTIQAGVAGLTLANNIVLGTGTSYIDNNGGLNVTLNGAISGGGTLDLTNSTGTGTGKVTLAPGSSYSGGTVINSNVIASVSADTSLGAAPGGASAINILFNNGGDLLGVGNPVTLNANRGLGIGSPSVVNTATATAFLDASGTLQIGGTVAGAGNAGTNNLTINGEGGTGTVELLGVGTFNGITTISNGTLEIGNALALQNSTLNYTNGGILTFDGTNGVTAATIGAIMGAKNLALANSTNGPVALSLEGINSSTTYAGGFIDSGAGSSIIKNGSGTLTLTGASTITGATVVNNGTLLINPGGALNCGGVNMPGAGETFEVNGGSLTSSGAGVLDDTLGGMTFLVNGGTATFNADLGVVSGQNTTYFIHVNTNGTLNATSISLGRSGDSLTTYPTTGATTLGLYNSGGTINVGNLNMSTNALDNSSTVAEMDSGILNVTNGAYVGNVNGGRWSILDIKGGTFTALDTNVGLSVGIPDGSSLSLVLLQGGTTTAGIVSMGNAAVAGGQYVLQQTGGTLYVGVGGISNVLSTNSGSYLNTSNILSGGVLAATTNWTSITPFLFGGTATIQTADSNNNPWNIILTGGASGTGGFTKTGAGTLTMGGGGPNNGLGNAWAGATVVSAGTLALVTTNSVAGDLTATTSLTIASNATVDVTGLTDVTLHIGDPAVSQSTAQTLLGNGTINGNVKIGPTGTLSPGAAATSLGNLTITGSLTNGDGGSGGGAILMLVDHPFKGATNSSVSAQSIWITNNLGLGGTNVSTLTVNQGTNSLQTGDVFQLFNIAGNTGLATARNLVLKLPAKTPNGTITYVWNTNNLAVNGQLILTTGAPFVSPIPTNLTFGVSGSQLTINWPANQTGWTLQTNSNLANSNGWVAVAGSTNVHTETFTITTNTPQLFYRLEHASQ
jgi:autotransporter-associated beta strand protein